jgi:hypothetical protein
VRFFRVFVTVENYVEKCGKRVERRVGKKRGKSLEKEKLQSDMELYGKSKFLQAMLSMHFQGRFPQLLIAISTESY